MSTSLSYRARSVMGSATDVVPPFRERPLASPPPGSGLKAIPGDPGIPLLGRTFAVIGDTLAYSRRAYARYGTVSWTNVAGTDMALVLGPEAIGTVLANRDRAFSNERGWNHFIGPFFERGVMLMDFEEHRHHRRIMQQAFRREKLLAYLDLMNPAIARGLASWPTGREFRLYDATKQLTLDIATQVFEGRELGPEADRVNEAFIRTVIAGQAVIRADVPGGRWHRGLAARRFLQDHFRRQIPAKRAGDGDDLFSALCRAETEDGERFSDEDVVNHMIFLMMAAHDTTTITLAMFAHYLGQHPEWQDRLREESLALGRDVIGYDDVDALPSMDLAFRETLRMNAPVGMLAREALVDTEIDGYHVPAGTRMMLGVSPTHRMEPWWNDPDTFDPERFSPERREDGWHTYAWAPFGGSVHKCIGMHFGSMEVKAILHQMLLRYRWESPAGYEPPVDYGTGPFPADGLPLTLRPL